MPGLLDAFNSDDGKLGIALLAAAGPSMQPMSFGQRLAGAMQSLDADKQNAMKLGLLQSQMDENNAQTAARKAALADQQLAAQTAQRFFTPGRPATGLLDSSLPPNLQAGILPQAAVAPRFDMQGFAQARMGQNPVEGMKLLAELQKEKPINKLDVKDFTPASVQKFAQTGNYGDLQRMDKLHFADTGGGIAGLDPFTGRPVSTSPKTGNPFTDLIVSDGNGGFAPNSPLIGAKQSIAKAGATNVKIENKMGESIAGQIGPMLHSSFTAANGAAQQVDAANRIIQAVDTNKLFTGPGAGTRLKVAQVSQLLGIGGKDDAEKIANTRAAIRGLSEMTLQGRKQMTGQGAITESEGALAEKAQSGNIEDLTAAEIKQLAQASSRAARFVYAQHQQQLQNVASDPNTAKLAPFYRPMPMPPEVTSPKVAPAATQTQPGAGVRFLGFE